MSISDYIDKIREIVTEAKDNLDSEDYGDFLASASDELNEYYSGWEEGDY